VIIYMNYFKSYLKKLVFGEEKGFKASILRFMLLIMSLIYSLMARLRYRLYQFKIMKSRKVDVPVLSIGNITTGGTGKTPFSAFLIEKLKDKYKLAVISRGYGAEEDVEEPFLINKDEQLSAEPAEAGDELFMLARTKKDVIFIRSADRYSGAQLAADKGADLILLDDGFQHYQLQRDLDIVIVDAEDPFSNGRVLPAGLLREPFSALKRADIFLINRSENITFSRQQEIKKSLNTLSPNNKGVFSAETQLEKCITVAGQEQKEPGFLEGKKVFAFSGIGSPEAFKNSINSAGGKVVSYRIFDDHYNYKKEDLLTLLDQYEASQAELILTTEKDAVKLFGLADIIGNLPLYYLTISLEIDEDKKMLHLIKAAVREKNMQR